MIELDKVYYCCELCRGEMHVKIKDVGFYPEIVACDKCEGIAILNFNPPHVVRPEYLLIKPNSFDIAYYRLREEVRYRKLGFSKIECEYLFEYEIKFIKKGGLILV